MSVESRSISFFRDRGLDDKIEKYVLSQAASTKNRAILICKGMAKVIDDIDRPWINELASDDGAYVSLEVRL